VELKLKEKEKSANEMNWWTVGKIHLTIATDLDYGTGYTGSAVKFQDNQKRLCSNQSHLPLSVISTFERYFVSWTLVSRTDR